VGRDDELQDWSVALQRPENARSAKSSSCVGCVVKEGPSCWGVTPLQGTQSDEATGSVASAATLWCQLTLVREASPLPNQHGTARSPASPPAFRPRCWLTFSDSPGPPQSTGSAMSVANAAVNPVPRNPSETAVTSHAECCAGPNRSSSYSHGWNIAGHQFDDGSQYSRADGADGARKHGRRTHIPTPHGGP